MGDVGWAVNELLRGQKITRRGWNGRGQFLMLQNPDAKSKMTEPYVYITTVHGKRIPWLCSQADLLANDWVVQP